MHDSRWPQPRGWYSKEGARLRAERRSTRCYRVPARTVTDPWRPSCLLAGIRAHRITAAPSHARAHSGLAAAASATFAVLLLTVAGAAQLGESTLLLFPV